MSDFHMPIGVGRWAMDLKAGGEVDHVAAISKVHNGFVRRATTVPRCATHVALQRRLVVGDGSLSLGKSAVRSRYTIDTRGIATPDELNLNQKRDFPAGPGDGVPGLAN